MSTGERIVPEAAARISLEGYLIRIICSGSTPDIQGLVGGYHDPFGRRGEFQGFLVC